MRKLADVNFIFHCQGTSTMGGKKRHKYDDYVDLGAGYDENDSFIDNTDAVRMKYFILFMRKNNCKDIIFNVISFMRFFDSMTKLYPKR